jgi:carbon monoxide dehydrogenase subunit G
MRQTGEHRIGAAKAKVWEALNDTEVLKRCIEGCEELTRAGEGAYHAIVRVRLGPVNAAFSGEVRLKDLDPPNGYTLEVSAKGGAAGFASGTARVTLTDDGDGTRLAYEAEGRVGGKLAQIGQRLIDAAARKTADDFFEAFAREFAPATFTAETPPASAEKPRPRQMLVWGAAAAAVAALGLLVWRLTAG